MVFDTFTLYVSEHSRELLPLHIEKNLMHIDGLNMILWSAGDTGMMLNNKLANVNIYCCYLFVLLVVALIYCQNIEAKR